MDQNENCFKYTQARAWSGEKGASTKKHQLTTSAIDLDAQGQKVGRQEERKE